MRKKRSAKSQETGDYRLGLLRAGSTNGGKVTVSKVKDQKKLGSETEFFVKSANIRRNTG